MFGGVVVVIEHGIELRYLLLGGPLDLVKVVRGSDHLGLVSDHLLGFTQVARVLNLLIIIPFKLV